METSNVKEARLVARVSKDIQQTIHKAASYSGATISQFLIDSAVEKARNVINDFEIIKLSDEAATRMMKIFENPPAPNDYLKRAFAHYKESIVNDIDTETSKDPQQKAV